MASAVSSPGVGGSESFQPSENQEGKDIQPTMSVSNGPSSPDASESSKKEKKPEEIVKKFDNINYVEAPLPKTNPWTKTKNVSDPGMCVKSLLKESRICFIYIRVT